MKAAFSQQQVGEVPRGGDFFSASQMFLPVFIQILDQSGYFNNSKIMRISITIISPLLTQGAIGFPVRNPQTDTTQHYCRRPGTDVIFAYTLEQLTRKLKHGGEIPVMPGEKLVYAVARFVEKTVMDTAAEIHQAKFNHREGYKEDTLVILHRNATHNLGIILKGGPELEGLDEDFTLPLEDKKELGFVTVFFHTFYNFTVAQVNRVINEGRVQ